ncbi:hypothetical protein AHF37_05753, partial [Paragonimus kellicotti]
FSVHFCFTNIFTLLHSSQGGWNGQTRVPFVYTYDTESNKWLPPAVAQPLLKGFPAGAGLSAHTSTLMRLDQSKNSFSALIIGREGSLRTQRKSGNIYCCTYVLFLFSGWRGHAAIPGDGGIFISSGEGFNALVRDPLDSAFVLNCRDGQTDGVLYNVGKLTHPRAYGVSCVHATDGTAWFHGGIGSGGKTQNSLLRLERLEPTEESGSK